MSETPSTADAFAADLDPVLAPDGFRLEGSTFRRAGPSRTDLVTVTSHPGGVSLTMGVHFPAAEQVARLAGAETPAGEVTAYRATVVASLGTERIGDAHLWHSPDEAIDAWRTVARPWFEGLSDPAGALAWAESSNDPWTAAVMSVVVDDRPRAEQWLEAVLARWEWDPEQWARYAAWGQEHHLSVPDPEVLRIVDYHEGWVAMFEFERRRLTTALRGIPVVVEHIGSTAVPDLAAKPIIDIAVGLRSLGEVARCIEPIEGLGYEYLGEYGVPGRHYFRRGRPESHHVHVVELGGEVWSTALEFRDLLRSDHDLAERYADTKRKLAAHYGRERRAYTDAKAPFILRALGRDPG